MIKPMVGLKMSNLKMKALAEEEQLRLRSSSIFLVV